MSNLMIFEGHNVEVLVLGDQVLFNPKHVAEVLDIKDVKSSIRDFSPKQKVLVTNSMVHTMHFRKIHNTGETFITESGVYKLAFKSRKPEAERFTDWVTDEVLPQIRKTGSYSLENRIPKTLPEALRAYAAALEENEKLIKENETMKPKAGMYDTLISAGNSQSMTEVAKCFGVGRNKLFKILREEKVLMSGGSKKNLPFQRYIDNDYFDVREVNINRSDSNWNVTQTLVTAKGLDFIGKVLRKRGYIQEIA